MVELHLNPSVAEKMGAHGRERAEELFNFPRMLTGYEDVYEKAVELYGS
jgi:glycosyltransferase involved in cell wall biosynthesis